MVQQINLLTPILMAPKRYFSATAMAQALGLIVIGAVIIGAWTLIQVRQVRQTFAQTSSEAAAERKELMEALARLPSQTDATSMNQMLATLQQANAQRQLNLLELQRGRSLPGRNHSDVLLLLARSVPPPVWLTEMRWSAGRMELEGKTLQPEALQPWVKQLSADALLQGQQLSAVKVERLADASSTASGTTGLAARTAAAASGKSSSSPPVWKFTLISTAPAAGSDKQKVAAQ